MLECAIYNVIRKNRYFLHEASNFTLGDQMALCENDNSAENNLWLPWLLCRNDKNMIQNIVYDLIFNIHIKQTQILK